MKYIHMLLCVMIFSFSNAQNAKTLLDSALLKKEQLKFYEGIKLCEQAIALDSTLVDAYFYKAGFHTALIAKQNAKEDYTNYKAAIRNYTKVMALDAKNSKALFYRGGAHDAMGFLDQALVDYQKSIKIKEHQPEVYNSMGVCFAKKGKLNLALHYFEKAVAYDKMYAKAHSNIGNVYDMKQDISKACEHWKRAIELGYIGNQKRYQAKCKRY